MEFNNSAPAKRGRDTKRGYTFGTVAALMVAASFVGGFFLGESQRADASLLDVNDTRPVRITNIGSAAPIDVKDVDFEQFWDVWSAVKSNYVDQGAAVDEKMFYGAIQGMVAALGDPYSVYFDPEMAQQFADEMEGTFQGIGAEIGVKKNQLLIVAPLPETPASRAGLRSGDYILKIDDTDTTGMSSDEAVSLIRGEKGTTVRLTIYREGDKEPREVPIVRDQIVVNSVKHRVVTVPDGKKIGVIEISSFNGDTTELVNEAARSMVIENVAGIIVDVRNNPGGYLDSSVEVASEWVGKQLVVTESYSDGTKNEHFGEGSARLAGIPTVVLVNGGSASASEILAGALQDSGLAQVVGAQTFGKGSVQDYAEFGDGSALKLTIALWLTPSGRSINKEGIVPDVAIDNPDEDWDNNLDSQFDKAVEILTGYVNPDTAAVTQAPSEPTEGAADSE